MTTEPQTATERIPAEVFAPGELIVEELIARFADDIGCKDIDSLIAGNRGMTDQEVRRTAAFFGQTRTMWKRLNDAWIDRNEGKQP